MDSAEAATQGPFLDRRSMLELAAGVAAGAVLTGLPSTRANAMSLSEIVQMDAVALARAIRSRKASCVEVMTVFLDHIEKVNPKVNAIVALQDRDQLLAQARDKDDALGRGEAVGPLHGLPHAVKDLQPVKGIRTTFGSPIFKNFIPAFDTLMVERLRRAGAIFVGKTNAPEFGLGSQTFNPVYGATRNAYVQSRTAGGSSGGAAVALALRMQPLADGSDYGGSLRNPAGWNNVYGFRTSIGLIPNDARDLWLPSMGVTGPMARSPADLALLLSVQAGYDPRAPLSIESDPRAFVNEPGRDFKGTRIAWGGNFKGAIPYEPGVEDVCRSALKTFEDIGCVVEEATPDYSPEAVWHAFVQLRAWQSGSGLLSVYDDPVKRASLKPEAIYEIETGMKVTAYDITNASVVRSEWYMAMARMFARYDFFVLPTAQLFPFDIDWRWPQEIAGHKMASYHEWMKAVCLITMAGSPALAVPAGFSSQGLPIGLQIVAANRRDLSCLQLAHAYHAASGWTNKRLPPLLTDM
jgi:amidase